MMKKLALATTLSVILLSGCGGGSSNGEKNPNTIEVAHKKLIGSWIENAQENGCHVDTPSSSEKTITKFSQNDVLVESFEYNNTICNSSGLTRNVLETFEYSIEGTDKSSTGKLFYKTSFTKTGITIKKGSITNIKEIQTGQVYKIGLLFDGEHLIFSEKEDTPNQYSNDFNLSNYMIKQ